MNWTDIIDGPEWHNQAACRNANPDLFFPEQLNHGRPPANAAAAALAICDTCPVIDPCRDYALTRSTHHDMYGIWGGLTAAERAQIRRRTA